MGEIVTAAREFPVTSRVDVQVALEQLFAGRADARLLGIHASINQEAPTLAHLFTSGPFPIDLGPLQHDEVDIGDAMPVRCLKNGLWLAHQDELPFVVVLGPSMRYGQAGGVHVEIAVPAGERARRSSRS